MVAQSELVSMFEVEAWFMSWVWSRWPVSGTEGGLTNLATGSYLGDSNWSSETISILENYEELLDPNSGDGQGVSNSGDRV